MKVYVDADLQMARVDVYDAMDYTITINVRSGLPDCRTLLLGLLSSPLKDTAVAQAGARAVTDCACSNSSPSCRMRGECNVDLFHSKLHMLGSYSGVAEEHKLNGSSVLMKSAYSAMRYV